MAARTRAAARTVLPEPDDDSDEEIEIDDDGDSDLPLAKVIPFGAFEAGDERRYR